LLTEPQVLPNNPLKRGRAINDLFDQLDTCPDTRFQAVHLFHRYFLRVAEKQLKTSVSTTEVLTQAVGGNDDTSANGPGLSSDDSQDGDDYEEAPNSDGLTQAAGGGDDPSANSPRSSSEDSTDGDDDDEAPGSDDTVVVKGEQVIGSESESDD